MTAATRITHDMAGAHDTPKHVPDHDSPYVVYGFFGHTGRCLYVGQTQDLPARCAKHHNAPHYYHAREVRILATGQTRREALRLEAAHIRTLDPLCNVKHSPSNPEFRARASDSAVA